jgi:hypothetical protein
VKKEPTIRVGFTLQEVGEVKNALRTYKEFLERAASQPDARASERAMTMVDLQNTRRALEKTRKAERSLMERLTKNG